MSLQKDLAPTTGDEVIQNYTINFGPQHLSLIHISEPTRPY